MARESKRHFVLGVGLSIWLFAVTGCSFPAATWYGTRRVPGYVVPAKIPLVVDVSKRAHEADQGGYIDTMVLTVREELGEHGVESTILSPKPSRLPSPRVEIIVGTFDDGDFTASYLSSRLTVVPFAGGMELAVVCRAYSPSNQLMFEGLLKGSNVGTGNPRGLAETAGDAIAEALTDPDGHGLRRPRATLKRLESTRTLGRSLRLV